MIPLWLATLFMIVCLIFYVIYHWHEDATTKSAKKKEGDHEEGTRPPANGLTKEKNSECKEK